MTVDDHYITLMSESKNNWNETQYNWEPKGNWLWCHYLRAKSSHYGNPECHISQEQNHYV